MRHLTNRNFTDYARIGAVCVLATAPVLVGCASDPGGQLSVREEAVNVAAGNLALNTAHAAAQREEAAAERRKRRANRRRFAELMGESNCYAEPRRQNAATVAIERMLDGVGGEYYSEGGHGGGGGGGC